MKVQFIVIGKTIDKHLIALIDEYAKRVTHYMPFTMEVIPELKNTKALTPEQQKEREGELYKSSCAKEIMSYYSMKEVKSFDQ